MTGAVGVGPLGLDGDEVSNRRHHGGPDKAVYAWQALDDAGHAGLVKHYFEAAGFGPAEVYAHRPKYGDPLYGVIAKVPRANS